MYPFLDSYYSLVCILCQSYFNNSAFCSIFTPYFCTILPILPPLLLLTHFCTLLTIIHIHDTVQNK